MQYIKSNLLSLIAVLVVFVGSSYVFASTHTPGGNPPTNNVPAPINVGPGEQKKGGSLWLNSAGINYGLIVEKGNVGIGTPTPGAPLEISSASDGILRLRQQGGGWNYLEFYNNNARTAWLGMETDTLFSINNQINLNTTNGNVGIGTTNPGAFKLNVSGDSNITGRLSVNGGVASGQQSIAMGFGATASGFSSIAMGFGATSSGVSSIAMGNDTQAIGNHSTAMGWSTTATASGYVSTAMGSRTTASGYYSTAMGSRTTASGMASTAMGNDTKAIENDSTAMGSRTTASGMASTAMGTNTTASGTNSTAMGASTTASGTHSTAMGIGTTASGTYSTAMGASTIASGLASTAMGISTTASGNSSTAMGRNTIASGSGSTAMGANMRADSVRGMGINVRQLDSPVTDAGPYSFGVMYGQLGSEKAFLLQGDGNVFFNGRVGIGTLPSASLSVIGNANKSGGGSWANFSDARLKTVTGTFDRGLSDLMKLQPIKYRYNKNNPIGIKDFDELTGFVAQEVEVVIPEAVNISSNGYRTINADPIFWTMFNSIKEQQKQIEELKIEIEILKNKK